MNHNLKKLIDDYLDDVAKGMALFNKLTGDKRPIKAWRDKEIMQRGSLSKNLKYELHGIGCFLEYPDYYVNFDFGPNGRFDGFDLWRLSEYLSEKKADYPVYKDPELLKQHFEQAVTDGDIAKNTAPYCKLYYFKDSL